MAGSKPLIFMHFHEVFLGSQHEVWSKQHNGKVRKVMYRVWAYFHARLAFTMAAFNVLVQWHGLKPYASGFVPLSIAEFSL